MYKKMYLITHKGLNNGQQLAQTNHALTEYALNHPDQFKSWHDESNYIVVLETQNEHELHNLYTSLAEDHHTVQFREPDLDDSLTAIATLLEPENQHKVSHLRLAGRPRY